MSATPTEIHELAVATDTHLADLHGQAAEIRQTITSNAGTIKQYAGAKKTRYGYDLTLTEAEAIIATEGWEPSRPVASWGRPGGTIDEARTTIAAARIELAAVEAEIAECNKTWQDNGRWSRFYLVMNVGGHIHKTAGYDSDRCSTCYPTTEYAWLPSISGLTEADAVAQIGPRLCSVCFPSAPVEHRDGELHATRIEREARQAERQAVKDARLAKRIEKALFVDDPDRFIEARLDRVDTIAKARSFLKTGRCYQIADDRDHSYYPQSQMDQVAAALAVRLGITVDEVWAENEKKAQAQHRKDIREGEKFKAANPHLAQYFKD